MILITSAAYVVNELQFELGKLPSSFMPVANRRLYEHQAKLFDECDQDIYISVPKSYELNLSDEIKLKSLKLKTIFIPDELSLGDSIAFAIDTIGSYEEELIILHGDTLLKEVPLGSNLIGLASSQDQYSWEVQTNNDSSLNVWCGYFSLSDVSKFRNCLHECGGGFVSAVKLYSKIEETNFIVVDCWYDFGHLSTYFKSRSKFTTERNFNEIEIVDDILSKSSFQTYKIKSEAEWFRNLPHSLQVLTPRLFDFGNANGKEFYKIQYMYCMPLNELLVYGKLPKVFWAKIFSRLQECISKFTNECVNLTPLEVENLNLDYKSLILDKTKERVSRFIDQTGISFEKSIEYNGNSLPSIFQIMTECFESVSKTKTSLGIWHGDLCFSNILYDSRSNSLVLIDPRAINSSNKFAMHGNIHYDIAKLAHSVIGHYDYILAGSYSIEFDSPYSIEFHINTNENVFELRELFARFLDYFGLSLNTVYPMIILLFISMLPLHCDSITRQRALYSNVFRLYRDWRSN